jgi:hypothetical protein
VRDAVLDGLWISDLATTVVPLITWTSMLWLETGINRVGFGHCTENETLAERSDGTGEEVEPPQLTSSVESRTAQRKIQRRDINAPPR